LRVETDIKWKVEWKLLPEATDTKAGGDLEQALTSIPGKLRNEGTDGVEVIVPREEGGYRLFVKAIAENCRVAYANIPFYAYPRPVNAEQRQLIRLKSQEGGNPGLTD
jgi:hypothetical protein